jgi:HTH-type transcriptional regulator/antitoxin HigA
MESALMPRVRRQRKLKGAVSGKDLPSDYDALVRMLPPRAIHDEAEYENTQDIVDALTSVPWMSRGQSEYLETLSVLMQAYEQENHEIDTSHLTPLDMLKFLMEQHDLTPSQLGKLIGSASLASMILRGERELSKGKIILLARHFKVDPGVFL